MAAHDSAQQTRKWNIQTIFVGGIGNRSVFQDSDIREDGQIWKSATQNCNQALATVMQLLRETASITTRRKLFLEISAEHRCFLICYTRIRLVCRPHSSSNVEAFAFWVSIEIGFTCIPIGPFRLFHIPISYYF